MTSSDSMYVRIGASIRKDQKEWLRHHAVYKISGILQKGIDELIDNERLLKEGRIVSRIEQEASQNDS